MSRAKKDFIQGMHMKKGALHRELHVPEGKKIPVKKIEKAEHSSNKLLAKRATLAHTLSELPRHHGHRD